MTELPPPAGPIDRPGFPRGVLARARGFLVRHPIVCLFLLTPGIPEYLSSSSSLSLVLVNPVAFLIFLGANAGMYLPGVLLIREARIRWKKGWASVMLLGAAYGILEEGVALSTLFNPQAGPVGVLGAYGHFAGVNWVWSAGVLMVHIVFSISLPILLLELALPSTKYRSLLGDRGVRWAFGILGVDILLLLLFVTRAEQFWIGAPLLLGSLAVMTVLIVIARRVPADLLVPTRAFPTARPAAFAVLGFVLFPATILLEGVAGSLRVPAAVTLFGVLGLFGLLLFTAARWIGRSGHETRLIAFAAGAVAPIALIGVVGSWPLPLVLVEDLLLVLFLRHLWNRYRSTAYPREGALPSDPPRSRGGTTSAAPPAGALGPPWASRPTEIRAPSPALR